MNADTETLYTNDRGYSEAIRFKQNCPLTTCKPSNITEFTLLGTPALPATPQRQSSCDRAARQNSNAKRGLAFVGKPVHTRLQIIYVRS